MEDDRVGQGEGAAFDPVAQQLVLSAERLAFLRPRLRALLDDFRELDALAPPGTEPAFAPVVGGEEAGDAR